MEGASPDGRDTPGGPGGRDAPGPAAGVAPGRPKGALGRLPLAIALLALVALLAVTASLSGVFRSERQDRGAAASARSNAPGTTRAAGSGAQAPPSTGTPGSTGTPTSARPPSPPGQELPPGWRSFRHPTGAYSLAYPQGWRLSALSDDLSTTSALGPAGLLFRVQSSDHPTDPVEAWRNLERTISGRAGYQRIRLGPGRYKGLPAAVWEFSYLSGGQRVHKLDVTFKSADGRWGYAVLLQAPEPAWSRADGLSSQFEQAFTPTG